MALTQVKIDKSFLRNVGYRTPLSNNIPIPLPSGKVLGAPCRTIDSPISQQLNSATFIQTGGPDPSISGLAINRQWSCARFVITSETNALTWASVQNLDQGARLDQILESTSHNNNGVSYETKKEWVIKFYETVWARFVSERGLTHPSEHNWYGDYFFPSVGKTGAFAHWQHPSNASRMDLFKTLLSSEANARRDIAYNPENGVYSLGGMDEFYARGLHNYINRHFDGYYNTAENPDPAQIYHILFMIEMHHLANSGLKVAAFDHTTIVDGSSGNGNGGVHLRMPLNPVHNAAISNGWNSPSTNGSWQTMHSFFSFAGFDGSIIWNEMFTDSNSISNWSYNIAPDISTGNLKTYRTQNGLGPYENYDGSFPAPSAPAAYRGTRVVGNNLVFAGAKYYSEISSADDRVSGGMYYAENNYSVNGGSTQNGYNGTDVPVNGSLGNSRISDKNNRNYNNVNAADLCKLGKPVVLRTRNTAGTKEAFILCNPYADDGDTTVYNVKDKDGVVHTTAPLAGDRLYILKKD